jgi:hypothetical protein
VKAIFAVVSGVLLIQTNIFISNAVSWIKKLFMQLNANIVDANIVPTDCLKKVCDEQD